MEEKKENKETKKKTITRRKKVEEKVQEVEQPQLQPQMTIEQMQQMMLSMMQIVNNMQQQQTQNEIKVSNAKESKKTEVKERKRWTKSDLSSIEDEKVAVRSVINNVGFISRKTGIQYSWAEKGDVETMTVKDILAMETRSKRYLRTPWLVIDDERLIEALRLGELYGLIEKVADIDNLIDLGVEEISRVFEKLPNEYKKSFRNEIYVKVKTHELKDITIISALSEILDIDLMEAIQ